MCTAGPGGCCSMLPSFASAAASISARWGTVAASLQAATRPGTRPVRLSREPVRRGPPPDLLADCALFLDIDGTLIELAPTPEHVMIDDDIARLLPALGRHLGGAVALITGRTIRDADKLFPGLGLPVAGQHGLERRSADGVLHTHGEGPPGYGWLHGELDQLCARHDGLWLEDKG